MGGVHFVTSDQSETIVCLLTLSAQLTADGHSFSVHIAQPSNQPMCTVATFCFSFWHPQSVSSMHYPRTFNLVLYFVIGPNIHQTMRRSLDSLLRLFWCMPVCLCIQHDMNNEPLWTRLYRGGDKTHRNPSKPIETHQNPSKPIKNWPTKTRAYDSHFPVKHLQFERRCIHCIISLCWVTLAPPPVKTDRAVRIQQTNQVKVFIKV